MAVFKTWREKSEHCQSKGHHIAEAYELCRNAKRFAVLAGRLPLLAAYEPLLDLRPDVGAERQLAALKKPSPPPASCSISANIRPAARLPKRNPLSAVTGLGPCVV